ncbi:unnamed protein product [Paramecium octaurelia]|uniref:Uncharacterized protein n=1 Tax=Paramecium octaurelia TaxID=43137 RepID=A0A8S1YL31_PAROT|nr:unnamed protein product [Paramecium octaurelia]
MDFLIQIIMNIIISGSEDNTIKFWQKQNQWLCTQTITDHNDYVYGLSMNESQNKVIQSGEDKLILVIELSEQNEQWTVIQKITVETDGVRLCFIDNDTFTFQPWQKEYMQVLRQKGLPLEGGLDNFLFPYQYIQSKCIFVNENAENVNLIRKIQNQSIQFGTLRIFGYMSDDGKYLITWDNNKKQYQIRKYQEL